MGENVLLADEEEGGEKKIFRAPRADEREEEKKPLSNRNIAIV